MRKLLLPLFLLSFCLTCTRNQSSVANIPNDPSNGDRVAHAYAEKETHLQKLLKKQGIDLNAMDLFLRGFKKEQKLEVWAKPKKQTAFTKVLTYDFCDGSGILGPKRQEGDLQIPEGFYHIDRLNPRSNFYLSLGLNYPNTSDKIRGDQEKPGSDIFIHGGCATIGCIPITNEKIKELYVLVEQAQTNGQKKIPVHLFPTKMETANLEQITKESPEYVSFWTELQMVYQAFEQSKAIPGFTIDPKTGAYQLAYK